MAHGHWDEIGQSLLFAFPFVPHTQAPASCQWHPDANIEHQGQNYRTVEAPFRKEIDQRIETFCQDGDAANPSPEAAYFLGQRSAAIEYFVMMLGLRSNDPIRTAFLLPPDMSRQDAARWMFIDWWDCHGPALVTKLRICDQHWAL
jgi:hypothetical protein